MRSVGWWMGPNPVNRLELPKFKEPKRKRPTVAAEDVPRVLAALSPEWRPLFATAFFLGLRPGELLALQKEDIDLRDWTITVRRSNDADVTKGGDDGTVPIPEPLRPYIDAAIKLSPSKWVFPAAHGRQRAPDTNLKAVLRRALGRAGIEDMRAAVAKLDFGPLEERAPAPVVPLRKEGTFATNLLPAARIPKSEAPDRAGKASKIRGLQESGRLDLNQRPLAPQASALPGCATPRHGPAARGPRARRGRGKYHPPRRASTRPVGGVERVLQHLRGAERQHAARADLDLRTRLRVAADARLLLADDEVAEAGQLDLLGALERVLDGVEHHLHDLGALLLGEPGFLAHALDDVGLGHDGNHSSRRAEGRARRASDPFRPSSRRATSPCGRRNHIAWRPAPVYRSSGTRRRGRNPAHLPERLRMREQDLPVQLGEKDSRGHVEGLRYPRMDLSERSARSAFERDLRGGRRMQPGALRRNEPRLHRHRVQHVLDRALEIVEVDRIVGRRPASRGPMPGRDEPEAPRFVRRPGQL